MKIIKPIRVIEIVLVLSIMVVGLAYWFWKAPRTAITASSKNHFTSTIAHDALTQEKDWLNVLRPLTPQDLQGRILLIDFWTYCCINCMHIFPDLKALEEEFGEALTVVGVHSGKFDNEKDPENIRAAMQRHEIKHPVVNDADYKIWDSFGVQAWPTLILINPEGKVEAVLSGEGHLETLRRKITQLKKQYTGRLNTAALPMAQPARALARSDLRFPGKIAYAPDRNWLFISDSGQHRILVTALTGKVLYEIGKQGEAGKVDGGFSAARFRSPQGLLYREGKLYVADTDNHLLREIDFSTQQVKTVAGTGEQGRPLLEKAQPALKTALSSPWDLASYGRAGDKAEEIAIAMAGTHQLWTFNPQTETVSVLAGNGRESLDDGAFPNNSLSQPSGLASYQDKLYLVDAETSSLRVLEDEKLNTLIGTGLFDFGFKDGKQGQARMQHPLGVWTDATGVYIADAYNHAIRRYDPKIKTLTTFLGNGKRGVLLNEPNDIIKIGENLWIADTNHHQIKIFHSPTKTLKTLKLDFSGTSLKK